MKRNEMVEIINKKLIDSTDGYVECNLKSFKQVADILLDEMEYRGMLPPFDENIEESKVGYGAAYLSDEEVRLRYIRHFCKWKPEDV
jgi:hypothetical protein